MSGFFSTTACFGAMIAFFFVDSFEYALAGPNFNDSLIGYSKYIDVNSFIDLYIINELFFLLIDTTFARFFS